MNVNASWKFYCYWKFFQSVLRFCVYIVRSTYPSFKDKKTTRVALGATIRCKRKRRVVAPRLVGRRGWEKFSSIDRSKPVDGSRRRPRGERLFNFADYFAAEFIFHVIIAIIRRALVIPPDNAASDARRRYRVVSTPPLSYFACLDSHPLSLLPFSLSLSLLCRIRPSTAWKMIPF